MKKLLASAVLISLLTSCATIRTGKTQQIRVNSTPPGANCSVANKTSSGSVTTPGVVEVSRSMSSLNVSCQAPGYGAGETQVKYGVNWWSAGNILFLGFPYFYDMYTGAVAQYPENVDVQLKPTAGTYTGNFQMRDYNSPAVVPNNLAQPQQQYMQYQQLQQPQTPYAMPQYQQMQQPVAAPLQNYDAYQMPQAQSPYQQPAMIQQQQIEQPQTQQQLMQEMMRERQKMTGGGQNQ